MKLRVLFIDDSPAMRSFIRRVVEIAGLELNSSHEAGHGQEAIALLKAHKFDLIFCDINMPVMNGEDFLLHLRENMPHINTPVIVVSTDSTHPRVHRLTELGAKGYVKKPFTPEMIRTAIEEAIPAAMAPATEAAHANDQW